MTNKTDIYDQVTKEIFAVIDGEPSRIARFASAACLLSQAFEHYYWTGFYLVDEKKGNELVIGPYQGTLGCLRIPFSRGVCGASARDKTTVLVENVHDFEGHIACDSATNSEIVVPVCDESGKLVAVLDVDSTQLSAFDEVDQKALENICEKLLIGASQA